MPIYCRFNRNGIFNFESSSTYVAKGIFWTTTEETTNENIKTSEETKTYHHEAYHFYRRDLEDVFLEFDPFIDMNVGHMVAMNTSNENKESGIPFFLGKVAILKNVSSTSGSMKIIWY